MLQAAEAAFMDGLQVNPGLSVCLNGLGQVRRQRMVDDYTHTIQYFPRPFITVRWNARSAEDMRAHSHVQDEQVAENKQEQHAERRLSSGSGGSDCGRNPRTPRHVHDTPPHQDIMRTSPPHLETSTCNPLTPLLGRRDEGEDVGSLLEACLSQDIHSASITHNLHHPHLSASHSPATQDARVCGETLDLEVSLAECEVSLPECGRRYHSMWEQVSLPALLPPHCAAATGDTRSQGLEMIEDGAKGFNIAHLPHATTQDAAAWCSSPRSGHGAVGSMVQSQGLLTLILSHPMPQHLPPPTPTLVRSREVGQCLGRTLHLPPPYHIIAG